MFVIDTSMFLAALFADEQQPIALELHRMVLEGNEEAMAPPIFLYEACNVVMQSLRRRRIDKQTAEEYLELIYGFPLRGDEQGAMPDVVRLAEKHTLTTYDASYLELGKRLGLPLATLDGALAAAAKRERVTLLV